MKVSSSPTWSFWPHQVSEAPLLYSILKKYGIVALNYEERTGKTGLALQACELSKAALPILIITKKKALSGWEEHLANLPLTKEYILINYESVHKIEPQHFPIVILDESSAFLSAFPKLGKIAEKVRTLTYTSRIVLMSATIAPQSNSQLFHQMHMSKHSPWNAYPTFYNWHQGASIWEHNKTKNLQYHKPGYTSTTKKLIERLPAFGTPNLIRIGYNREVESYKKTIDLGAYTDHLFMRKTRKELGFDQEPEDSVHFIKLNPETVTNMNKLGADKLLHVGTDTYVADSGIKLSIGLQQLEGSTLKISDDHSIQLPHLEKVNYIKQTWGDTPVLVIFYHFKEEEHLLKQHFKQALVLQGISYSMGVDLHKYTHHVLYSFNWSVSTYTQARCRMANMNRKDPIIVNYLLVKNSISEKVYDTIKEGKKNYVDVYYKKRWVPIL